MLALIASTTLGAAIGFIVGTMAVFAILDATGRGCEPIDYTGGPCPNAVGLLALVAGGLPGALVGGVVGMVATLVVLMRRGAQAASEGAAG